MDVRTTLLLALSLVLLLAAISIAQPLNEASVGNFIAFYANDTFGIDAIKLNERFLKDSCIVSYMFIIYYLAFSMLWHRDMNIVKGKYMWLLLSVLSYDGVMSIVCCFDLFTFAELKPKEKWVSQITFSSCNLTTIILLSGFMYLFNELEKATDSFWVTFFIISCICLYLSYGWLLLALSFTLDSWAYVKPYAVLGLIFGIAFQMTYVNRCWAKVGDYLESIADKAAASYISNKDSTVANARSRYDAFLKEAPNTGVNVDFPMIDLAKLDEIVNRVIEAIVVAASKAAVQAANPAYLKLEDGADHIRNNIEAAIDDLFIRFKSGIYGHITDDGLRFVVENALKSVADAVVLVVLGNYPVKYLQNRFKKVQIELEQLCEKLDTCPTEDEFNELKIDLENTLVNLDSISSCTTEEHLEDFREQLKIEQVRQTKLKSFLVEVNRVCACITEDRLNVFTKQLETIQTELNKVKAPLTDEQLKDFNEKIEKIEEVQKKLSRINLDFIGEKVNTFNEKITQSRSKLDEVNALFITRRFDDLDKELEKVRNEFIEAKNCFNEEQFSTVNKKLEKVYSEFEQIRNEFSRAAVYLSRDGASYLNDRISQVYFELKNIRNRFGEADTRYTVNEFNDLSDKLESVLTRFKTVREAFELRERNKLGFRLIIKQFNDFYEIFRKVYLEFEEPQKELSEADICLSKDKFNTLKEGLRKANSEFSNIHSKLCQVRNMIMKDKIYFTEDGFKDLNEKIGGARNEFEQFRNKFSETNGRPTKGGFNTISKKLEKAVFNLSKIYFEFSQLK